MIPVALLSLSSSYHSAIIKKKIRKDLASY
jgi:hypothetical protein